MSPQQSDRVSRVKAALSERHTVALTIWAEARGEFVAGQGWRQAPIEARIAVASVIRNRYRTPGRFGLTFKDVCLKPYAFSCWPVEGLDTNSEAVIGRAESLIAEGDGSVLAKGDAVLRECLWLADGLLADVFGDRVRGATHYYAASMPAPPKWAFYDAARTRPIEPVAIVGGHRFYAGIR